MEDKKELIKLIIKALKKKVIMTGGTIVGSILFIALLCGGGGDSASASGAGSSYSEGMESVSNASWEQFMKFVVYNEGGTKVDENGNKDTNGKYYKVENDGAGNPTIGHGLCLHSQDGYLHVDDFKKYDIDSKKLADDWLKNGTEGRVEVSICDKIWEDHLKNLLEGADGNGGIKENYITLNLTEYQLYALVDVKYRRGNTKGFEVAYKQKWNKSDNEKYYGKDISSEEYSMDSLYSFFNNGMTDTSSGVYTRKKNQWLLFKYGYYAPLKTYWQKFEGGGNEVKYDSGKVVITEFTSNINNKTYKVISQNAVDGWGKKCNRAAATCIVSGENKLSVEELIKKANEYQPLGNGISTEYFKYFNLVSADKSGKDYKTVIQEILPKGGCVAMRFQGPNGKTKNSKNVWAKEGHWISIIGYKEEDGKQYMYVGDPGHGNTGWYPLNEFDSLNIQYIYAITQ